jgi:hypothetical protein
MVLKIFPKKYPKTLEERKISFFLSSNTLLNSYKIVHLLSPSKGSLMMSLIT